MGRFAVSSRLSPDLWIAALSHDPFRQIYIARANSAAWTLMHTHVTFGATESHPAIVAEDASTVRLFYLSNYNAQTATTKLFLETTTNGGGSFDGGTSMENLYPLADFETRAPGVAATYDPATGKYISMWRDRRGRLKYHIEGNSNEFRFSSLVSTDTPSISCSPNTVTSSFNCLLAWRDANHWRGRILWTQCRVEALTLFNDNLVCNPPATLNFWTEGAPSIAWVGELGSFTWQLAFKQYGLVWTMRKRGTPSDDWEDLDLTGFGVPTPEYTNPVVGARDVPTADRRYIFGSY